MRKQSRTKVASDRTEAEETLLAEVLVAVRRAVRTGDQLSILFDVHFDRTGADVSFMFDPSGYSLEVLGEFCKRARRK